MMVKVEADVVASAPADLIRPPQRRSLLDLLLHLHILKLF